MRNIPKGRGERREEGEGGGKRFSSFPPNRTSSDMNEDIPRHDQRLLEGSSMRNNRRRYREIRKTKRFHFEREVQE